MTKSTLWKKEFILAQSSGEEDHDGGRDMAVGRHDGWNRKLTEHVVSHKHEAEGELGVG